MITLNNIVDQMRDYYSANEFIKTLTFGEIELMDLMKRTLFPIIHVTPGTTSFEKGVLTYSFEITACDLLHSQMDKTIGGITSTKEVKIQELLSDTLRYLQDLDAEIRHGFLYMKFGSEYELNLPISCEPFVEEYKNVLVGWTGSFSISVNYSGSSCDAPLLDDPTYNSTYVES